MRKPPAAEVIGDEGDGDVIERPAADTIRRCVEEILTSDTFARSERLRSFLAYVVDRELSGQASHLKGYAIGMDVFDRSPGFDASNDPLVRVQAGKLRKLLDIYYESEGSTAPVRIRIPVGSYVPEYECRAAALREAENAPPEVAPAAVAAMLKRPMGRWVPAPVSSHLALLTLLPLFFLVPSVSPDAVALDSTSAKLVLATKQAAPSSIPTMVPTVRIQHCWPSTGNCRRLAEAIGESARYHHSVRVPSSELAGEAGPLSYTVRIENEPSGDAVYARIVHDQTNESIYVERFHLAALKDEARLLHDAVAFAARTLSPTGMIYRHAIARGSASNLMVCLSSRAMEKPDARRPSSRSAACRIAVQSMALNRYEHDLREDPGTTR
ncbi:hypothetical protein [Sinorhizobium sp. BG8]|uniref:hypothetical protein n=1 Tax=Sinorhizobium sp. BG8 TaxID=2613773 RepID=UPI00193E72B2|nr:hypothetical protein [Sinorhizobium sp. BG8]QRM55882.1 hypothetical protein F3Y30_16115 [Sinorhizobium sp. BG8]